VRVHGVQRPLLAIPALGLFCSAHDGWLQRAATAARSRLQHGEPRLHLRSDVRRAVRGGSSLQGRSMARRAAGLSRLTFRSRADRASATAVIRPARRVHREQAMARTAHFDWNLGLGGRRSLTHFPHTRARSARGTRISASSSTTVTAGFVLLLASACAPAPASGAVRAPSADYSPPSEQASNGQVLGADRVPPGDKLATSVRITPAGVLPASQPIATTGVGRTPPPNTR
jgi:hypothetical protein